MKKITGILMVFIIAMLSLAGCGNEKISVSHKVTDVKVFVGNEEKENNWCSLSDEDRERFMSIYESVINSEDGKTGEEMQDKLVDGGFWVSFYKGEEQIDGMGINGEYFVYDHKYYHIPDTSYNEVKDILENSCDNSKDINNLTINKINVTDIKVSLGNGDKEDNRYSLSDEDREKFMSIYESVVNSEDGKTGEEMQDKLVDGGLWVSFYNGKEELEGMDINGQYFFYDNKYYHIPDTSYNELKDILENSCGNSKDINNLTINKIDVVYQGDLSCGTRRGEEKDKVLKIFRQVISTEKPACKIAEEKGSYTLIFYDNNDNIIDDLGLNGQFIYYNGEYYHISDDIFSELLEIIEK